MTNSNETERRSETMPGGTEAPGSLRAEEEPGEAAVLPEEAVSLPEAPEERTRDLAERELELKQREQTLESGRDQLRQERDALRQERDALASSLEELQLREACLEKQREELSAREEAVHAREMKLKAQEQAARHDADEARRQLEKELFEDREAAYAQMKEYREQETARIREEAARMRTKAEEEAARREAEARGHIEALYLDAEKKRQEAYNALEQELSDRRREAAAACEKLRADARADVERREQELEEAFSQRETELEDREKAVEEKRRSMDADQAKNLREQRRQERKESELEDREAALEEEVEERSKDLVRGYQQQLDAKEEALRQLRDQVVQLSREQTAVKDFKALYGGSPEQLKAELARLRKENRNLENQLVSSPDKAVQDERDRLLDEKKRILEQNKMLQTQTADLLESQRGMNRVSAENAQLQDQIQDWQTRFSSLQGMYQSAQEEIHRLSTAQSRLAERDERLKAIQTGGEPPLQGIPIDAAGTTECEWLDRIWSSCKDFGMVFPRRILYAFHTALKISDWSMITVLSGVSGTGKSELPKLYAAFGGLNFISVPVQPSWDSQESMLGFFNSIDNRFEPEPLLRYLYQCTEDPKFSNYMSIVLLDEMNLAHVEHYFADFLSKLEMRRSMGGRSLPKVEVKLGAGVEPYYLELKRSILWTGTMNQDETTKSLSDKVLDRGLVIYFPRPEHLEDRKRMEMLQDAVQKSGRTLMTKRTWGSWIVRSLEESKAGKEPVKAEIRDAFYEKMGDYRRIVEQINNELEGTGRALGHRVWQAIQYYIVNYPTVRQAMDPDNRDALASELKEAMNTAFEDQLVQKVMPKLRGIETRGEGRQHLQKIEDLLEQEGFDRLKDDFDLAMELGYGQFIWRSAKYIQSGENGEKAGAPEGGGQ